MTTINVGWFALSLLSKKKKIQTATFSYQTFPFFSWFNNFKHKKFWKEVPHIFLIHFMGSFLWHCQNLRLYSIESKNDRWVMNWERFGKRQLWPNQGNAPAFTWMEWGKPQINLSGYQMCWANFEVSTSKIQVWSVAVNNVNNGHSWLLED